jgi:hypothetical protein
MQVQMRTPARQLPELLDPRFWTFDRFAVALIFIGLSTLALVMPVHNDTWWHLRAGYDMLASRTILTTDTFSFTAYGNSWGNHQWLSEVIFAAVHHLGGLPLLTATCAAAVIIGLCCLYASMTGPALERAILLVALTSGATLTWSLRAQAFTLMLLGVTVLLTYRERWAVLPPVFVLWANLHSAVPLGLLVLAGMLLGQLGAERRLRVRPAVSAGLCALATLATPSGVGFWSDIVTSMARSRANQIIEWRPPELPPANATFWVAAAVFLVLVVVRRDRLQGAWARGQAVAALLALVLALRALRNVSTFLILCAAPMSVLLLRPTGRTSGIQRERDVRRGSAHLISLAIVSCAAAAMVAGNWSSRPDWHPISAAAAAAVQSCHGPLYNRYEDGGPLIFFAPRQKVLLDSRQDPFPVELVQAQFDTEATGDYAALFSKYRINCAAVPPLSPTAARLTHDGWRIRFTDAQWTVLERPRPLPPR